MKKYKPILLCIGLGLMASLLILLVSRLGLFGSLDGTFDWRFKFRGEERGSAEIVIVYVEQGIRDTLSRSHYALLLGSCAEEAGAVGLDLLLDKPNPGHDELLEQALRDFEGTAGIYLVFGKGAGAVALDEICIEKSAWNIKPDGLKLVKLEEDQISAPLPGFCRHSRGVGHAYLAKEKRDQIIRKIPLLVEHRGNVYPLLALQILKEYLGIDVESTEVVLGDHIKLVTRKKGQIKIPIDNKARMMVNYIGEKEKFKNSYTLAQVIEETQPIEKSHIVLVGARVSKDEEGEITEGADDAHPVPLYSGYPGVAIHANIIDNILKGQFLRPAGKAVNVTASLLFGLMIGGIVGTSCKRREARPAFVRSIRCVRGLLLTVILFAAYSGFVVVLFRFYNIWLNVSAPSSLMLAMMFIYFFIAIYQCDLKLKEVYTRAGKEKIHRFTRLCLAGVIVIATMIFALIRGHDKVFIALLLTASLLVAGILSKDELINLFKAIVSKS